MFHGTCFGRLSGGEIKEGGLNSRLGLLDLFFGILRSKMNLVISSVKWGTFTEMYGRGGIRIHVGISESLSFLGRTVYNTDSKKYLL